MQTNWVKLKQLTTVEKLVLAQALILLPINALGLRLFGFYRWQAWLAYAFTKIEMQIFIAPKQLSLARMLSRIVNIAAAHGIYEAQCLPRSLTLWWLLQRRKIPCELRIGVRKDEGNLAAHAWVECAGDVISDRIDIRDHFVMFSERFDHFGGKSKSIN